MRRRGNGDFLLFVRLNVRCTCPIYVFVMSFVRCHFSWVEEEMERETVGEGGGEEMGADRRGGLGNKLVWSLKRQAVPRGR